MEENMVVNLGSLSKTFYFDFDWPKNLDDKYEIKFIIKSNESLA